MQLLSSIWLGGALAMPLLSQGGLQASLTAVTPIVVSGTSGASVTHPAGLLPTAVSLTGPVGTTWATFQCALVNSGSVCTLTASSNCAAPFPQQAQTQADLLLLVSAPTATVAAVQIEVAHLGDSPWFSGFRIDIGNDGSFEVDTSSSVCCGTIRRHHVTADFLGGPLSLRITDSNAGGGSPQAYTLSLHIEEWLPSATPIAAECPGTVNTLPTNQVFYTNYQLAAFPPTALQSLGVLRAIGLGRFDLFLVSDQPAAQPLQLPGPYVGLCDVLSNIVFAATGTPSGSAGPNNQFTDWSFVIPTLPPGLVFHVQHGSATRGAPFWFGATNRLRIDT